MRSSTVGPSIALLCLSASAVMVAGDDPTILINEATQKMDQATAAFRKTGNFEEVVPLFTHAESEFSAVFRRYPPNTEDPQAMLALLRSADCLRILRRWDVARERYRTAIALTQHAGNVEYEAKAWLGIEKLERMGAKSPAAASEAADNALRLVRSAGHLESLEANILAERAELEFSARDFQSALSILNDLMVRAQNLADRDLQQSLLFSRGGVLQALGEQAFQGYTSMPQKTAHEWKRCEAVAETSLNYLNGARKDYEDSSRHAQALGWDYISGVVQDEAKRTGQLIASMERLIDLKRRAYQLEAGGATEERSSLLRTGIKLGEIDLLDPAVPIDNEQQRKAFIAAVRESLKERGSFGIDWRQRYLEGQLVESEGNLDGALGAYRNAAELVEKERRALPTEDSRARYTAGAVDVYDRLFLNLLKRGEEAQAFHWLEQSRAREIADQLSSMELRFPSQKERSLYAQLTAARASHSAALKSQNNAAETERRVSEILEQIRTEAPRLLELIEAQPVSLTDLRKSMQASPYDLVYYFLQHSRLIIWHIGPASSHVKAYFAALSEVQRLRQRLWESVSQKGLPFDSGAAKDLYQLFITPIAGWLETGHVVVVAPPNLPRMPWQALLDEEDGKFAGEKLAITFAPSASVAVKLRPGSKLERSKLLTVVGPGLDRGADEMAVVESNFADHAHIVAPNATRSAILEIAPGKTVIHVAAHGTYNEQEPLLSGVELSPEPGRNGRLTAAEMFELPLHGVSLVTFASCQAAQAKAQANNELSGIMRSLLYAGAQNLLLPLWDVDEEATIFWLSVFYREARSKSLPQALRLANEATHGHEKYGSHPRLWAAFTLTGR